MKKQYTSMQQELAARKAAAQSGASNNVTAQPGASSKVRAPFGTARKRAQSGASSNVTAPSGAARKSAQSGASSKARAPFGTARKAAARFDAAHKSAPQAASTSAPPEAASAEPSSDKGDSTKSRATILLTLAIILLLITGITTVFDSSFDDDGDYGNEEWAATSDYGIDENANDQQVRDYLLDQTDWAPTEGEIDEAALTKWLEDFESLLTDVPGAYTITILENRILITTEYSAEEMGLQEAMDYWEDAYFTINNSLWEASGSDGNLDAMPVCLILRETETQDLHGIRIDNTIFFESDVD